MSDSIKTRAELIQQIAFVLGILGDGQTLESDAQSRIDERIGPVTLSLATRNIVDISNIEALPAEYFLDLADCVADACAGVFGKARDPGMLAAAEDRLAAMARISPASKDTLDVDGAVLRSPALTYARWLVS